MNTRRSNPQPNRKGITLIECLVYVAILGAIMTVGFSMYYHMSDGSRSLHKAAADIVRALDAGERWRDDLHAASGTAELSSLAGGGQRFAIHRAGGDVVYEYRDNAIWRQAGSETNLQLWLAAVKSSAMVPDSREHVKAWRWELELQTRTNAPGGPQLKPLFTFVAVAGGSGLK